ncbi:hypothetical protein MP228_004611 [Amoeboaphelidium protococcarum]|nr:hypothetical protein MP228_004611 [Amoeboaphelidium protococcarum]
MPAVKSQDLCTKIFDDFYAEPGSRQAPKAGDNLYLINGEIRQWTGKSSQVYSPVLVKGPPEQKTLIGSYGMLTEKEAMEALDAAVKAYDYGRGLWCKIGVKGRIAAMSKFVEGLKKARDEIVEILMWEICKNKEDAQKEVDRTITYIVDTIAALKAQENAASSFITDQGVTAQIRRAPLGVMLCSAPQNYPLNESYTTLIPALLMGNTAILKIPRVGVLCHYPTFKLFKDCFPPGVVNVLTGSGREIMPALMKSGHLDGFALIGTSSAADSLLKHHPKPHRLKVVLGLEAKNPAIVLPDADLNDVAVPECVLGSFSYMGQRCTAIKLIFVHESIHQSFVEKFAAAVDRLPIGCPWVQNVKVTPIAEEGKIEYLQGLVDDALSNGASIANKQRGGKFDRTFYAPTVLTDVTKSMRIYFEEQFGPIVPIVKYKDHKEIFDYLAESQYGQQASIFGQKDTRLISELVDDLVHQVSRVNINSQCQRGPDSFPFTGRKDSAIGTLSVTDALRAFSIRSVVATKVDKEVNKQIFEDIVKTNSSKFLRMEHLF